MFTNRKAVLLVDDDQAITRLVASHLEAAGYTTEAIHDPLATVQTVIRGQFRVVILDVNMPNRSGLQVLQELKQFNAGIQVIMLTGLVNETTLIEANRHGAEACFFKPLSDPEPFLEAVEAAFTRNARWWHTLRDLTQRRKESEAPLLV